MHSYANDRVRPGCGERKGFDGDVGAGEMREQTNLAQCVAQRALRWTDMYFLKMKGMVVHLAARVVVFEQCV